MKKNIKFIQWLVIVMLAVVLVPAIQAQTINKQHVRLNTSEGVIMLGLYDETPLHCANFLKLVKEHYFDGLLFHRVIRDFMIQGGDPDSRNAPKGKLLGDGGPDYTLPSEFCTPVLFHKRGALAAAREGDEVNPERRSSASQFYIVYGKKFSKKKLRQFEKRVQDATSKDFHFTREMKKTYRKEGGTPHLDAQYTVFGEVLDGMDIVKRIQKVGTDENNRPIHDVKIISAEIVE